MTICMRRLLLHGPLAMLHLVAVAALLAASIHTGDAVRCYVCSSLRDAGCKDPFNKDYNNYKLKECSQESMENIGEIIPGIYYPSNYYNARPEDFACVKAVKKEYDREEVIRTCSIPRPDTFDVCSQLKSRHLTFCKSCTGDSCNGAEAAVPRSLIMTLLPASVAGLGLLARPW